LAPRRTSTDPATLGAVWIPQTARQEWLIITRDRRIQDHRVEIEAVRSSGARMVNLAADDATDRLAQMEVSLRRFTGFSFSGWFGYWSGLVRGLSSTRRRAALRTTPSGGAVVPPSVVTYRTLPSSLGSRPQ